MGAKEEWWHFPVPILPSCRCRQDIFFFLAESSRSFLSQLPGSHRHIPRRDAVLSRQPSTPLTSGPAHSVFLGTHNCIRCSSCSRRVPCALFPPGSGLERFSSWCDPCRVEESVERDLRGIAGWALLPERYINNTDAWPISRRSQVQPSCLRASEISTVITEALNA